MLVSLFSSKFRRYDLTGIEIFSQYIASLSSHGIDHTHHRHSQVRLAHYHVSILCFMRASFIRYKYFLLSFLLHPFLFIHLSVTFCHLMFLCSFSPPSLPLIPRFFSAMLFVHHTLFFLPPSLPPSLSFLVFSHRTLAIYQTPPPRPSPLMSVATIATPPLRPPPPP